MLGIKRRALPANNPDGIVAVRDMRITALAVKLQIGSHTTSFGYRSILALESVNYRSRILAFANGLPVKSYMSDDRFHNILQKRIYHLDSKSRNRRMIN